MHGDVHASLRAEPSLSVILNTLDSPETLNRLLSPAAESFPAKSERGAYLRI